jgi:ubiquinone/menaquinone biosynthesis C-methylase UbiE
MSAGHQNNFSKQAEFYSRYRPVYPPLMYEFLFRHLERKKYAWDCGTGSGQVAGYLAGHFEQVYANDISAEQLEQAVKKDNIQYVNKPAENTGFPPGLFDLVTAAQAIHWFDIDRFYEEVRRTTRQNGLLAVFGYGKIQINREVDPVINDLYKRAFSTYFRQNREYLNQEYRTIPFPFDEIPAPRFTIKSHWTLNDLEGYFNSWSPVQRFKSEKEYNPADETMEIITGKLPAGKPFEVRFPVFMRLGRVTKS